MATRVMVFIDYANAYRSARRAFFDDERDPGTDGHFHPLRLALKLKGLGVGDRELVGVRVYRGLPSEHRDPVGAAAADRQAGIWRKADIVVPVTRTLNYRDPKRPREKGIDVALAIDFVMLSREEYDVGILFSEDTDLLPALEAVANLKGSGACETGCWKPTNGNIARPLLLPKQRLGNVHLMSRQDYDHVCDRTDYNIKRRRR